MVVTAEYVGPKVVSILVCNRERQLVTSHPSWVENKNAKEGSWRKLQVAGWDGCQDGCQAVKSYPVCVFWECYCWSVTAGETIVAGILVGTHNLVPQWNIIKAASGSNKRGVLFKNTEKKHLQTHPPPKTQSYIIFITFQKDESSFWREIPQSTAYNQTMGNWH